MLPVQQEIPGFGVLAIDTRDLLPQAAWPQQIEAVTFYHVIRPRYEILGTTATVTFAHMNVERTDLRPEPEPSRKAAHVLSRQGLPAAGADLRRWDSWRNLALPTPAARGQMQNCRSRIARLPGMMAKRWWRRRWACACPRRHAGDRSSTPSWLAEYGITDPCIRGAFRTGLRLCAPGVDVDGWLHALFRYEQYDRRGCKRAIPASAPICSTFR